MKKKRLLWLIPVVLLLAVLIWAGVFYFILRNRSLASRPLVLIQSPLNGEYVDVGEGVAVQAVARVDEGVHRMQIWVDDELVAEKNAAGEDINSPMVIITRWVPAASGRHVVSVRAFSGKGMSGHATVFVTAEQKPAIRHVVQEGETLEIIAASYGIDEAAIMDANEGTGTSVPQAGDELEIPAVEGGASPPFDSWGDETASSDSGSAGGVGLESGSEAAEDAPAAAAPEPGSPESLGLFGYSELFKPPGIPIELEIKVTALQTREAFDALHCYVSLAGNIPTWVPDADYDQSTDETFDSRADGTEWNVAEYLSGTESSTILWYQNSPVPINISCVGVTDGGLDAVELGWIHDDVTPDHWGVPQTARSSGGESQFNLAYMVTFPEKGLDPAMTVPWNVRLHEGSSTLSWAYLEDIDGNPAVDGFAIFLNDQLQFTVNGRTREADIPPQWFEVPCNDEHRFTVVAFNEHYPEGDYSPPSEPAVLRGGELGSEGCPLSVTINFQVLNVGEIGNPIPVTAYFFANEQRLTLDGSDGVLVPEVDSYGIPRPELYVDESSTPPKLGLEEDHGYMIPSLFSATHSRYGSLIVELPYDDPEDPYDSLQLGFEIYGPDHRLICGGDLAVSAEDARGDFIGDIFNEYPLEGIPELCIVSLNLSPIIQSAGDDLLPDLLVEGITYDYEHGFHVLHLRNTGQADWVNKDLVIEATIPEGELIGRYTFRNATLEVNERGQLGDAQFRWEPILGACVKLDPDNLVREEIDRAIENGMLSSRGRFCPGLPDLTITDAIPLAVSDQTLVKVQNRGEASAASFMDYGALPPIDLLVEVYRTGGGDNPDFSQTFENVSLDNVDEVFLYLDISPDELNGYTIRINPDRKVSELNYENNDFTVEQDVELYLDWIGAEYEFCRAGLGAVGDNWTFRFVANKVGGDYSTPVVSWTQTAENDSYTGDWFWVDDRAELDSGWFRMNGDEHLVINLTARLEIPSYVDTVSDPGTIIFSALNNYGNAAVVSEGFPVSCMGWNYAASPSCDAYNLGSSLADTGTVYIHDSRLRSECYWHSYFRVFQRER